MNDTESRLPTGSESRAVSRLLKAGFESGETGPAPLRVQAPALLVYRSRSELLTVPQWREIAALARHAAKVPRIYSEGLRAERPHEPGTHR